LSSESSDDTVTFYPYLVDLTVTILKLLFAPLWHRIASQVLMCH